MRSISLVVLSAFPLGTGAIAQTWFPTSPTANPIARSGHAMAYDPVRGYTVLFGGSTSSTVLGDTWIWNGTTWTQLSPGSSPAARYHHAMAFDPTRNAIVLFGGRSGSGSTQFLGDTWTWNGSNWVPLISGPGPAARAEHAMAFHAGLGSVLLYGGVGNPVLPIQTWALGANGWNQLFPATSPPSNSLPEMAATAANGRCTLFVSTTGANNKFWEFTGTTWNLLPAPPLWVNDFAMTPTPDGHMIASVDSTLIANAQLLMYKWDGSQWSLRQTNQGPTTPSGWFNREVTFAYDQARGRTVLFSGVGAVADTWEFADDRFLASAAAYGTGCGSPALSLTSLAGSRPLLGTNFQVTVNATPSAFTWITLGLSETTYGSLPLPLPLDGLGFPGCTLYHDALVVGLPCQPQSSSSAAWAWPIPTAISLLGFRALAQAYSFAPSAPGALVLSNGLRLTMGNF